ncbi:enoyl-CoA hydratase/isomerase family protein [Sulfuricystis multivorans]|uniref:enoyl-CoA hydratase/isomerase family protein n=1 Tax=Sulfuricystis multivorans TaxID=2211108 RepID=UPI000F83C315|nr:enoyl-CoA hydratase/isomerase family protein [Sulfuricystis multivorans]
MQQNILTEIDAGVGIVTLNRPERHNAFDEAMIDELSEALLSMASDPAVRVVVISSIGKSFCAGADLGWMQRAANYDFEQNRRDAGMLAEMLRRIAECPKPVIARVQGPAYGGGVGVIAACDIAVATFEARFALTEVKLGLIPAVIGPYVVNAIGERYARRYMLTAEVFSAAEAYRLGLIHEMVADEAALDAAVGEWVEAILKNGPQALGEAKALIRAIAGQPYSAALIADTVERIARVRVSPEGQEGIAAFLEKRSPNWVA